MTYKFPPIQQTQCSSACRQPPCRSMSVYHQQPWTQHQSAPLCPGSHRSHLFSIPLWFDFCSGPLVSSRVYFTFTSWTFKDLLAWFLFYSLNGWFFHPHRVGRRVNTPCGPKPAAAAGAGHHQIHPEGTAEEAGRGEVDGLWTVRAVPRTNE